MGVDHLNCITFSGTGYAEMVGQNIEQSTDWPLGEPLDDYSRAIDFDRRTSVERFRRKPALDPASWKYDSGWLGETPFQRREHQTFAVAGSDAWHVDGMDGTPVAAPDLADLWKLDTWMTPHSFVKAARIQGAETTAIWRCELGKSARGGAKTSNIQEVIVVSRCSASTVSTPLCARGTSSSGHRPGCRIRFLETGTTNTSSPRGSRSETASSSPAAGINTTDGTTSAKSPSSPAATTASVAAFLR